MKRISMLLPVLIAICMAGCTPASPSSASVGDSGEIKAEWSFTRAGQKPDQLLIGVINGATKTLDIAIYSLTKPDIVDAIKQAKKRGVAVRLITDRIQSGGKSQQEALKLLGSAGIPMKLNKHSGLMHLKMTIADGETATTGSFNYSKAASTVNDEVLMVLHNRELAQSFQQEFQTMWEDTTGFTTITPIIGGESTNPEDNANPEVEGNTDANSSPNGNLLDTTSPSSAVTYRNCAEVKAAGKAPLHRGDPGYSAKLDRNGDGVACEK